MKQPKYITYRGAKYERIPTLSEIRVDPVPPGCCIIYVDNSRQPESTDSIQFKRGRPYEVIKNILDDAWEEEDGERPVDVWVEPDEIDKYSYYASIHEELGVIVCVQGRGAFGHLYDLAKTWVDLSKEIDKKYGHAFVPGSVTLRNRNIDPDDIDAVDSAMLALETALDNL